MLCWTVTDGKAGMENQCLALAEALGLEPVVKRVRLRAPWRRFLPWLRVGLDWAASPLGDPIGPPWPDIVISCGRQGIGPALLARRHGAFAVHIQNPQISPRHFDLVVAPRHDGLASENVFVTEGSLSRVAPESAAAAAERFAERLAALPRPRLAVLIGGDAAAWRFTPEIAARLADHLEALGRKGAGLMLTASRRTRPEIAAMLRERLARYGEFWDGAGENPYAAYLGAADAVLVTADSVNMASEAATVGRPTYILPLEGGSPKFAAFHRRLYELGAARPFVGRIDAWSYPPLRDAAAAADEIRRRLAAKGRAC